MASETRKRLESFLRLLSVATAMHTRMLPTMEVAMRVTRSTPTANSSRSMPPPPPTMGKYTSAAAEVPARKVNQNGFEFQIWYFMDPDPGVSQNYRIWSWIHYEARIRIFWV